MELSKVFIFIFITLGPIKLIVPFVNLTKNADQSLRRAIAFNTFKLSTLIVVILALIANRLTSNWGISQNAVAITGGLVLFLWGLESIHTLRQPIKPPESPEEPGLSLSVFPLTLPHSITPAGIAAIMYFTMTARNWTNIGVIIAILIGVMVLNLIAMLTADKILKSLGGAVTLAIVGVVLYLFQTALAVDVLITAFERLGLFS